MKVTFLGHSCFIIEVYNKKIIIDPFIKANPNYDNFLWEKAQNVDYILITHGHSDHLGDAIELAKISGAIVISNYEICNWLSSQNISCLDLNMGNTLLESKIKITMLPAIHSSSIELENGENLYGGLACGFLIEYNDFSLYHAGDTCLFSDMKLINDLYHPNIGLLPIGGRFTMSISDVVYACEKYFLFDEIIPMHYDTFPPIEVDTTELKDNISTSKVRILDIGEDVVY